jgi:hypothetical protein
MIRRAIQNDYEELEKLIREDMGDKPFGRMRTCQTYVLEDGDIMGFFTYFNYKVPVLQHFFIAKKYRSPGRARELIKGFTDMVKGYIIIQKVEEDYLKRIVKYYFRNARQFGDYFLTEV